MQNEIIKVAIVGPESSGKTFLAEKLAAHYKCMWVPEYAREYLEKHGHHYTKEDVEKIANGQLIAEEATAKRAGEPEDRSMLICDTNLLVIKIWMDDKYGSTPSWIEEEIVRRKYHLHLLTAPDIPYEYDPLRENPKRGTYFFKEYEKLLRRLKFPYAIISGANRTSQAVKAVEKFILL